MTKYRAHFRTTASATVEVDVPDYPPAKPLSRREALSRVARGEVYRYADPISRWSAPGRSGYRVMVTAHMRALIADGQAVEGEPRGMAVFAEITDAGRELLATPASPQ